MDSGNICTQPKIFGSLSETGPAQFSLITHDISGKPEIKASDQVGPGTCYPLDLAIPT